MIRIGDALKELRKKKGLSFRKLGAKVGISHNNLALYERNHMAPSLENAVKLSSFFEVAIEYLVLGDRVQFNYKDFELAQLTSRVDQIDRRYREIIKDFMRRVLSHWDEEAKLSEESKKVPPNLPRKRKKRK